MALSLDSRLLDQFLAAYRLQSLGRAARELRISQPALSGAIRRLEDILGTKLFHRRSTGVIPTAYGEALAVHAQAVHSELRNAVASIARMRMRLTDHVRVGIAPAMAQSNLSTIMADHLARHPRVQITLIQAFFEDLAKRVLSGRLDFAIAVSNSTQFGDDLATHVLFQEPFLVVAGAQHPLLKSKKVHSADLLEFPWVLPPRGEVLWEKFGRMFVQEGLPTPLAQLHTNSTATIKSILCSSHFLSFVPQRLVRNEQRQGTIRPIEARRFRADGQVVLMTSVRNPAAASVAPLVEEIKRHLS